MIADNIRLKLANEKIDAYELRIKDLESKLLKSLGHNEFICEGIKTSISIYENESWFFSMSPDATKNRLIDVMDRFDMGGKPEEYSCAMDVLDELIWKLSI